MEIMKRSAFFTPLVSCTPSYFNSEGEVSRMVASADPAKLAKRGRASIWGEGMDSLSRVLQEHRDEGSLKGVVIAGVAVNNDKCLST